MHFPLHKKMTNQEISDAFGFIAGVLALQGADRFRIRAYDNAAATIAQHDKELHEMFLSDADFDHIPAIGKTLKEKLTELFTSGNIHAFQEYVENIPAAVYPLWKVHGIGIKKAFKLATTFHLENADTALQDLLAIAKSGEVQKLEGFGEKSELDLIEALQGHVPTQRMPYNVAIDIANKLKDELTACNDIVQVEVLGSLRRKNTTVGDIDMGIAIKDIGRVKNFVKNMKSVKRVVAEGDQLLRVILQDDHQVDIKVSPLQSWGAFLQHFTGSKEHNIKLREYALRQNKSLSEHGIKETDPKTGQETLTPFETEEEFYRYLGLKWIDPTQRLGKGEIEAAKL